MVGGVTGAGTQYLRTPSTPQPPMDHYLTPQSRVQTSVTSASRPPPSRSLQNVMAGGMIQEAPTPLGEGGPSSAPASDGTLPVVRRENCWVTVFGFPREEMEKVTLEFRRIGETTREIPAGDNYMHLQYANEELARRAIDKDHKVMTTTRGTTFMIGVKPLPPEEQAVDNAGIHPTAQVSHGQQLRLPSELDANRLYMLKNDGVAVQPTNSLWARLGGFVFGA